MRSWGFSGGSVVKNLLANAGDAGGVGFNPWVRKIPWRGRSSPLQYSCLENPMERGAWWATVHGVVQSWAHQATHTFTISV